MNWNLICWLLQDYGILKKRNRSFKAADSILLYDSALEDQEGTIYVVMEHGTLPHFSKALVVYLQNSKEKTPSASLPDNYICLSSGSAVQVANTLLRVQAHLEHLSTQLSAAIKNQDVIDIAGDLLGHPLFYFDASYRILAISQNVPFQHDAEWEHMLTKGFLSLDSVKRMQEGGDLDLLADKKDPFPYKSDIYPFSSLVCNIWQEERFISRLNMLCIDAPPTELNIQECRIICSHLSRIARSADRPENYTGPLNHMVLDLLKGQQLSEELIYDRLRHMPKLLNSLIRVCSIEIRINHDPQILNYYRSLTERLFADDQVITLEYGEKLVLILHAADEQSFAPLLDKLETLLKAQNLKGGISNSFYRFNTLRDHFQQAEAALSLGEQATGVNHFSHIYFDYVLSFLPAHQAAAMIDPGILRLLQAQEQFQFSLTETLRQYLETGCNLQLTAQKLFIHKNTALYRLNHIREILQCDLEDSEKRMQLLFSFKILEKYPPYF